MNWKLKRALIIGGGVLALILGAIVFGRGALNSFFYPPAPQMPPVVQSSTPELLRKLETQVGGLLPAVTNALQPGLSDTEIAALEKKGGFKLNDDLRSLYRWHNGMHTNADVDLIPGHAFPSLQQVVEEYNLQKDGAGRTLLQRVASGILTGHRKSWLAIFPDGAGDGYFYDPQRHDSEGAFFFHFAEVGSYFYFPAFSNFLIATSECFDAKAYQAAKDGKSFDIDFDQVSIIWKKYGASQDGEQ